MERIMITMPTEMLVALDATAKERQQPRSQIIRIAMTAWLEAERKREFEELLAEGYREMAADLAEIANDFQFVQAEAAEPYW